MKSKKKLIVTFLIVVILFNSSPIFANNITYEFQEKEQEANKNFKETNMQIMELDEKITKTQKKITDTKIAISKLEDEIKQYENDIKITEKNIEEKQELLNKRLKAIYTTGGNIGLLELLLSSEDIIDFVIKLDMAKYIVKNDTELLQNLQNNKNTLTKDKNKLKSKKISLENNKQQLEKKEKKLMTQIKEKKSFMNKETMELLKDIEKITNKSINNLDINLPYKYEQLIFPVPSSKKITSTYGYRIHPIKKTKNFHSGIDIGANTDTDVVSALNGVIVYADWLGGYGKTVIISHGNNITTLYGHNSKLLVKVGEKVKKGDTISKVGSTGISTGPHLHFEIRINDIPINPMLYL